MRRYSKQYDPKIILGSIHLQKSIQPGKINTNFFCSACRDKDRQYESLLIHIESDAHRDAVLKTPLGKKNPAEAKKSLNDCKTYIKEKGFPSKGEGKLAKVNNSGRASEVKNENSTEIVEEIEFTENDQQKAFEEELFNENFCQPETDDFNLILLISS